MSQLAQPSFLFFALFMASLGLSEAKQRKKNVVDVQGACAIVKQLGPHEVDLLQMVLEDEEIIPEIKSCAVYQVGKILGENPNSKNILPSLRKLYERYRNDTVQAQYFRVRESICYTLGKLENTGQADEAVEFMGHIASSDNHPAVSHACITMLGATTTQRQKAAQRLIQILNSKLSRKDMEQGDITLVHLIVSALGTLEQSEAFLPLIQVLQSGYPAYVKKATERALQNIERSQAQKFTKEKGTSP